MSKSGYFSALDLLLVIFVLLDHAEFVPLTVIHAFLLLLLLPFLEIVLLGNDTALTLPLSLDQLLHLLSCFRRGLIVIFAFLKGSFFGNAIECLDKLLLSN
jgi:hypothetical protein